MAPCGRDVVRRSGRACIALAWVLACVLATPPAAADPVPDAVCATAAERQVLALVNEEREALGRAPLALDVRLNAAARRHADDMRANCSLSHTGSDGSSARDRMRDAGYPDGMAEVAAAGSWPYPPAQVVNAWMASSGHRAILADTDARHLGIGYAGLPEGCLLARYEFWAGGFWTGTTGDGPDSAFLDDACCPTPGGDPICLAEPGASGAAAAALALAALRGHPRRLP